MSYAVSEIMDGSAALLNDTAKSIFTYVAQLPYLNLAITELNNKIEENNVAYTNAVDTTFVVLAGTTTITEVELPNDLIEIRGLFERDNGSTDDYIMVTRCEFLPQTETQINELIWWAWINQEIKFIGANTDRQVKMEYIASRIPLADSSTSTIGLINSKLFLTYRTAALCSSFIGENPTRSQELNAEAILALDSFLSINTKGKQAIYTRRRPFLASYRLRSWGW